MFWFEITAGLSALQTENYLKRLPDVLSDLCFTACLLLSIALPIGCSCCPCAFCSCGISVPVSCPSHCSHPHVAQGRYKSVCFIHRLRIARLLPNLLASSGTFSGTSTDQPHSFAHMLPQCIKVKVVCSLLKKAAVACTNNPICIQTVLYNTDQLHFLHGSGCLLGYCNLAEQQNFPSVSEVSNRFPNAMKQIKCLSIFS